MSTPTTTNRPAPLPGGPQNPPAGRRPSAAGYWVGALVAVLSIVGAVVWGVFTFLGWQAHVEDFPRLTPPGTVAVSVTDPESHFIFLEHDRSTAVPEMPAVAVTGPTGSEVPTVAQVNNLRYDVPDAANRVGDAVLSFETNEPGTYLVAVEAAEEGTIVAVGDDLVGGWWLQVAGSVALLLGGVLVGLAVVIVTAVRRS